jgi:hypothetical protein
MGVEAGGGWHSILNEMIWGANHYSTFQSRFALPCKSGLALAGYSQWQCLTQLPTRNA